MVASGFLKLSEETFSKPLQNQMILLNGPLDVLPLDNIEFDFSDVFGPISAHEIPKNIDASPSLDELVYDDPTVIYSRSHSLVGPTIRVSQSLKLSKLALQETEESELADLQESSLGCGDVEESFIENDGDISERECVGLEDFEILKVVGRGAFGKVYQVKKNGSSEIFAMKVMRKDHIMEKNHVEFMKAERDILTKIDHPFIIQLRYSFQTRYRLYLVLDFVNGGHLFFQLYHQGLFREDLARVYTAEIVCAVSHLHDNGIMHRDLKPENILLDSEGHAMLTDFGLAKEFDENTKSHSMCGTIEYMPPETLLGKGYNKAADWWSVGILLYEMLTGKPPFIGGNRQKIQQKIIKDKMKLPAFLTSEAHSILKGLLQKEPSKRLGSGSHGSEEIKGHKWFKSINWRKLEAREIQPSFIPNIAGKHCVANFEECWTKMPLLDSPAASPKSYDNHFRGYTYVRPAPTNGNLSKN
jgi:p70 ribosomal S6 kinase